LRRDDELEPDPIERVTAPSLNVLGLTLFEPPPTLKRGFDFGRVALQAALLFGESQATVFCRGLTPPELRRTLL